MSDWSYAGKVVVHRDLPGEHVCEAGKVCWCNPVVVDPETDFRTTDEIIEASKVADC